MLIARCNGPFLLSALCVNFGSINLNAMINNIIVCPRVNPSAMYIYGHDVHLYIFKYISNILNNIIIINSIIR